MRIKTHSIGLTVLLALATVMMATRAAAQQEKVLHSFGGSLKDGVNPSGGLISDASGNLYGLTLWGGPAGSGAVFELVPKAGGGWTEQIAHGFDNTDGANPYGSVILSSDGKLYGTTSTGGHSFEGTVFELTPKSGGGWTEKVVHNFAPNGIDGFLPISGLVMDSAGNLYGTAQAGGPQNHGAVFELIQTSAGPWKEKILFTFNDTDGADPAASVTLDSAGNVYGTTYVGGTSKNGTVFELTPGSEGSWVENVLHDFSLNGIDGVGSVGGLIFDAAGNLYGTTLGGGTFGQGTVFELSPAAGGGWIETVLHSFGSSSTDGAQPWGGVIFDSAGNLYGTTYWGGTGGCTQGGVVMGCGIAFKLTPSAGGTWTETVLHTFDNSGSDGFNPHGGLALHSGSLYGTTFGGGAYGAGTAFVVAP